MKCTREWKQELRQRYRTIRMELLPEEKARCDRHILERLLCLYQYRRTAVILTYVSKGEEVNTEELIRQAWKDGKQVAVPRCMDEKVMQFYLIQSWDDLAPGTFGVQEPLTERCRLLTELREGLCIVPGMAFDFDGYRLGYGGGYYDRFLSGFQGDTAGLCYSSCVRWKLPRGRYDKAVDVLVTERYFRKCNSRHENEE